MSIYISKSLEETEKIAKDFLNNLKPNENEATVIGLSGDLGSGKTAFTKIVARLLGVKENITSPTFVIMKKFSLSSGLVPSVSCLIHIDSYRLENGKEMEALNWRELLADKKNLILIEWPEKIGGEMPENAKIIKFKFVDENTREISLQS